MKTARVRRSRLVFLVMLVVFVAALSSTCPAAARERVLHQFAAYPHGSFPSGLVADGKGSLYGTARGGLYNEGVVYQLTPVAKGNVTQTVLYNFTGGLDGGSPTPVVLDGGGNVFGFTTDGGANSYGVFYELVPSAHGEWKETVLYNLTSTSDQPFTSPSVDAAGNFYGQTAGWGPFYGEIYQLSKSSGGTWSEKVLYTFTGGDDGGAPFGTFAFDAAGDLYGTAAVGGSGRDGVVFELSPSSSGAWTETVLHNFIGGADGATPESGLIFDNAGNLYGTNGAGGGTAAGCANGCGTVFELKPSSGGTWTESILYNFGSVASGIGPDPAAITFDSSGNLYGTTYQGGSAGDCYDGCGTLFELSPSGNGSWTETVLYNFPGPPGGYNPTGNVVFDASGRIFGTTSLGGVTEVNGTIFESVLSNGQWKTKTAYAFPTTDGDASQSTLIADAEGNLYGTTALGGTYNNGTVFELERASGWKEKILYSSYESPIGQLLMDAAGNLYGSIRDELFELSPSSGGSWTEKTLAFLPSTPSGLIFDTAGNLYATLAVKGARQLGEVIELTPSGDTWTITVLHTFTGYPTDGASPQAGMVFDSAGNLYGTTAHGGSSANCVFQKKVQGCGSVFELSPTTGGGWNETVLYSFLGSGGDGDHPTAPVILDSDGNIYGTTKQGGIKGNCSLNSEDTCGTVFELSPSGGGHWTETVLHAFGGITAKDGANPEAGLVLDAAGNLYGTTTFGGTMSSAQYPNGFGIAFELSPTAGTWTESILHDFGSLTDGACPGAALFLDSSGNLYGTTYGTVNGGSVVFEIVP